MMLRASMNAVRSAGRSYNRVAARALSQHAPADASLWDRMGGEEVIRPMVTEIYELHSTDPLTKNWFGEGKFNNTGCPKHVIERVFTFFSAGIGGPYEYEGKDMQSTHVGMNITQNAFHALCNHVLVKMEEHKAGGAEEREEVINILYSLKDDVLARNTEVPDDDEFKPFQAS